MNKKYKKKKKMQKFIKNGFIRRFKKLLNFKFKNSKF